ncbi:MAG: SDR family oxidoreductase [Gammaproteobacteria bacterium]|nr:SDR family oxidoreductase [Gammaproteobacteria bacterium]
MQIDNKVVLITGAGTGIGAATARYMARRGARLALAGLPYDALCAVADSINASGASAIAIETDVRDERAVAGAVEKTVQTFGRLDVAVANAGIQRHRTDRDLFQISEEEWEQTQDVNLRGVMRTCKHALAQMIQQGDGGAIVIVSSITALSGGSANVSYSTAKTALLGLNRHIAVHYAKHGIRCNAICPGALERTPDWMDHPNPQARKQAMEASIPLGRLGQPEDIAPFIALLASDDASYATGAQFVIDGGLTIR